MAQHDHIMRTNLENATAEFRRRLNSSNCRLEYLETSPTESVFEIRIDVPFTNEHSTDEFKAKICDAVGDAVDGLGGLSTFKCNIKIFLLGTYSDPATGNLVNVFRITENWGKVQILMRTRAGKRSLKKKLKLFGLPTLSAAVEVGEDEVDSSTLNPTTLMGIAVGLAATVAIVGAAIYHKKKRSGLTEDEKLWRMVHFSARENEA